MKKLHPFLSVLFLISFGFSQNKVNINNLVQYGDKWFKENDDRPFSGIVFDISKETGVKVLECRYFKGLKNGPYNEWYNNGNKKTQGQYKNGLMIGKWKYYHGNGFIRGKGVFSNGDGLNKTYTGIPKNGRDGEWKFWYDNGQKKEKSQYVEGKLVGISILWYKNGIKEEESTFKNDKLNGYSNFGMKMGI